MKLLLLALISTVAFAGPLSDEVESVRKAKDEEISRAYAQRSLSKHLNALQKKCHKAIRTNGQQNWDIEDNRCATTMNADVCYNKGYYVRFTDGSIGAVGWDNWNNIKPAYECNLNR